jgi:hypothetical protein
MTTYKLFSRYMLLLCCCLALATHKTASQNAGITAGNTEVSYDNTQYALDLALIQENSLEGPFPSGKAGIKARIYDGGYVKIRIHMHIRNWRIREGVLPSSAFMDKDIYSIDLDQAGSYNTVSYNSAPPIIYSKLATNWFDGDTWTNSTYAGNDIRKAVLALRGTMTVDCTPVALVRLFSYMVGHTRPKFTEEESFINKTYSALSGDCISSQKISTYPVTITVYAKNAVFYEFYHPFFGTVTASDMLRNVHGENDEELHNVDLNQLLDKVDISHLKKASIFLFKGSSGVCTSISTHEPITQSSSTGLTFENIYKSVSARAPYWRNNKDTVSAYMGDVICFVVRKTPGNNAKPQIKGIPGVWVSPFNSTMQFICSPSITPGEFNPFIPWESQTHQKTLNTYPPPFQQTVPDWRLVTEDDGSQYWVWYWTLQREQNYKKTIYNANIEYPNTKTYSDGHTQRSEQSAGHQAEFLHYWKKGNVNNVYTPTAPGTQANQAAPKYTMTTDPDEILYVNSYKMYQITSEPESPVKLLMAPTFPQTVGSKTVNLIPWQYIWPGEQTTYSYDASGYPAGGFLLNDYVTEYRKYKEGKRGNTSFNTYYNGYLIEDYDTYRTGSRTGSSVNPVGTTKAQCGDNVWFNPALATGNNTHPGSAAIVYDGNTYDFRLNVVNPVRKAAADPKGFYGTIEGTNTPMGWNTPTTYTIKGLGSFSLSELKLLSLAVISYRPAGDYIWKGAPSRPAFPVSTVGRNRRDVLQQWLLDQSRPVKNPYGVPDEQLDPYGGVPFVESEVYIPKKDLVRVQVTGVWNPEIQISSGQSVLALYYRNSTGEKTILAGRNLVVMDPTVQQFAAPGSNSYPYSKTSLVGSGEIDLKEGEGEKVYEFLNDYRLSNDDVKGYAGGRPTYPASRQFAKTYTLIKGQKITFTTRDIGIGKAELFMSAGPWPWSSYYDMSRFMTSAEVGQNMKYIVRKIKDDYSLKIGEVVETIEGKNMTYTWNTVGDFAIEIKFMNSSRTGYVRVKVMDYASDALDNLTTRKERGLIKLRDLTVQEERWLTTMSSSDMQNPIFVLSNQMKSALSSGTARIAYVDDVPSLYKFNKGPRSTSYGDRFGEFNDYNNKYVWNVHLNSTPTTSYRPDNTSVRNYFVRFTDMAWDDYVHKGVAEAVFPSSWNNTFLRHCSSNHFPIEDVMKANVLTDQSTAEYTTVMDNIYSGILSAQSELGPFRVFPWIAKTPTDGYKIFWFNKGVTNLNTFFNGTDNSNGAWSGDPYKKDIPYFQNRVQKDYPTIDDDGRNFLEFYNNLLYGRAVIYDGGTVGVDEVYNENPKAVDADKTKPTSIFIASTNKTIGDDKEYLRDLFRNSYRVFEECRYTNGLYYENYRPDMENVSVKTSPSVNGMALIALCIAHRMQWDSEAQKKAEATLAALTRHLRVGALRQRAIWGGESNYDALIALDNEHQFVMTATATGGYPYHYLDIMTGEKMQETNNMPSTIDAAILCYGAMFARKYFSNSSLIDHCAMALYNSIDWGAMFKNGNEIYHAMQEDGTGDPSYATSLPFNEYSIISYLANNQSIVSANASSYGSNLTAALALDPSTLTMLPGNATTVQKFLRYKKFQSYSVYVDGVSIPAADKILYALSDSRTRDAELPINSESRSLPSNFVHQFGYYLCHPFTVSQSFLNYFKVSAAADYTYWRNELQEQSYFGCGAGNNPVNYSADAPFGNTLKIASPQIAIGYLPIMEVSPTATSTFRLSKSDLLYRIKRWCREYTDLDSQHAGLKYTLSSISSKPYVLWRLSKDPDHLSWKPVDISLLDFSTELFGLATEYIGPSTKNPTINGSNFFATYNNIFDSNVIPAEDTPSDGSIWSGWFGGSWFSSWGSEASSATSTRQAMVSDQHSLSDTADDSDNGFAIYPNPSDGNFNVTFTLEKAGNIAFKLYDLTGRLVFKDSRTLQKGRNTVRLSVKNAVPGIYILKVADGFGNSLIQRKISIR